MGGTTDPSIRRAMQSGSLFGLWYRKVQLLGATAISMTRPMTTRTRRRQPQASLIEMGYSPASAEITSQ
jgi:hypothetical protein